MLPRELIRAVYRRYTLPWYGIHGLAHWARVLENGLRLAERTGADPEVVSLFAVFHDAARESERWDPGHGQRGAELAATFQGRLFHLDEARFDLLQYACACHTDGLTVADVTVQTCWDADRLDLARAGIVPDPAYLCTRAARDPDLIRWADQRSSRLVVPEFVRSQWLGADEPEV